MNIRILDSHLREHLETKAKPKDIAKALSLVSASVEKIEEFKKDFVYEIEITTNRVDMASVVGIAREAAAVLPQFGFDAKFVRKTDKSDIVLINKEGKQTIDIQNKTKLVTRICGIILEVEQKDSPQYIKDRLEAAGIRSLNNLVDITNYVMIELGHPTHVFDYDRLTTKKLIIREAQKGEKIITLDTKSHTLPGGDIVADNGKGEIVDLLGVMGTLNSVVTDTTRRVLFFIDNNDPQQIRKTSMSLGIRTAAANLNEKGIDPELAMTALQRGIGLYQEVASAKIVSDVIDMYPKKWKAKTIRVSEEKIKQIIGVRISLQQAEEMLKRLDFEVKRLNEQLDVAIPSYRDADMNIEEDVIEEIARMYGYHNLPSKLPPQSEVTAHPFVNGFYFEKLAKEALRYWGFTEVYTYSMVSKKLLPVQEAHVITLKNPLDEEHVHMRTTLIPSLLEVAEDNKGRQDLKIFELANVYHKQSKGLPNEILTLSGIVKGKNQNFFTVKGVVEQLVRLLGIPGLEYKSLAGEKIGAAILLDKQTVGQIEIITENIVAWEVNFDLLAKYATNKKIYVPLAKYPPVFEDLALNVDRAIKTGDIIALIQTKSKLIRDVSLFDKFGNTRTFHIVYQSTEKNLTSEEVGKIRKEILQELSAKFNAKLKS